MKLCLTCFFISLLYFVKAQQTIYGQVFDAATKQPLPFSTIALVHSATGANAGSDGRFSFFVADSAQQIVASYIGYENDTLLLSKNKTAYNIFLKPLPALLNEVVITGVSKATLLRENPVAIVAVSAKAIDNSNESNLVDALVKQVPGLNAVKTGPNISKPFIRGLGYNRVLTLYDGIRQEGQQWGDEHGIEVDAYNMHGAEVIKGPASLMYGSDALAGVVSLVPWQPAVADSSWHGRSLTEYQSNNGLMGEGLRLGYNNGRWLMAASANYRRAKNYTNAVDGRVYNTGFAEINTAIMLGRQFKKGYTHLHLTLYDNLQGIPDGSRDSLSRRFTKQVAEGNADTVTKRPLVSTSELNSYALSPLHQHIQHYRIYTTNHYRLGAGELDGLLAWQQNQRREYNHPTQAQQAGMFVQLNTFNYGLRYNRPLFQALEASAGINGMYQNNQNKNATDFPIPNYSLFDAGTYGHAKWKYKQWSLGGGLRYDVRFLSRPDFYVAQQANGFNKQVNTNDSGAVLQYAAFEKTFGGLSLSLGGTYRVNSHLSLKANVGRAYRAPNITELTANGLDPGAHIVYLGNRHFMPEFSLQEDVGALLSYRDVDASLSLFNNNIQNYIYLSLVTDESGQALVDGQGNRTFRYRQSAAQLYGLEATLNLHPTALKGFSYNNALAFTYGFNTASQYKGQGIYGAYLPFIPPLKISSRAEQELVLRNKFFKQLNMYAEAEINASQNRYLALYNTETFTPGYTLLNAGIGTDIALGLKTRLQLRLQVMNIFNTVYQSNLSRLKYFEYYAPTPNNKSGIYGMGRNYGVKLMLPF